MVHDRHGARRAMIVLGICGALSLDAMPSTATPTKCLSPVTEEALKHLLAAGGLQETLGPNLTLTAVNLSSTRIALRVEIGSGNQWGIDLALPGTSDRRPDGRGQRFVFHVLDPRPGPDTLSALLAAAELIDRSIPETAFADCSVQPNPASGQSVRYRLHLPRAVALASATVQVLILLAATLFGWRVVRSM